MLPSCMEYKVLFTWVRQAPTLRFRSITIQHHVSFYKRAPRRSDVNSLLQTLHRLPAKQRINYKFAVLTFKTQQTSSPQYLSRHISLRTSARNTRSLFVPLLRVPFRRTSFARWSFKALPPRPHVWFGILTATCCVKLLLSFSLSLYFQIQT